MTLQEFLNEWNGPSSTVRVHTSGSTGIPKDMLVKKCRMLASARMTCDFLGLREGDSALLCMPLDYIAGKMMVVRCLERKLKLLSVPPSSTPLDFVGEHINFAAFVPLQVIKSLDNPKLKEIDNIIIGGGAIDKSLENALRCFPNKVYSSYGMTETLSHIALRPLSGRNASSWYNVLPGIKVCVSDEKCLVIDAPHLCADTIFTNDIAEVNEKGQFRIIGRKDNVINSGGIKIQIEEVERTLTELSGIDNFMITSVSDSLYGEAVVLLIDESLNSDQMQKLTSSILKLPRYWQPKHKIIIHGLPTTETSKPKRDEAKRIASQYINNNLK